SSYTRSARVRRIRLLSPFSEAVPSAVPSERECNTRGARMNDAKAGITVGQALQFSVSRFGRAMGAFAQIDILYKAIAFAIPTPLIGLLLKRLIARSGRTAIADVDIALFFFTTKPGVVALLLISGLIVAVSALEQTCLMAVGLAREKSRAPRVR